MIQIKDSERNSLLAKSGTRNIRFRFDRVLKNGSIAGTVDATGTISMDAQGQIKRTARFTIRNPEDINWLSDMLRPNMLILTDEFEYPITKELTWDTINQSTSTWEENDAKNKTWNFIDSIIFKEGIPKKKWSEWPLGLFILSTPTRNGNVWEVEAYDRAVILKEDCLTQTLFIPAGKEYLKEIESIIISAGITSIDTRDTTNSKLPVGREFEIGKSKLEIVNELLKEINYNDVYFDSYGRCVISKYIEPSASNANFSYKADEMSVLYPETSSQVDSYGAPNVIVAVCSNPDMTSEMVATYVNDSPFSPLSTVSRGRSIVQIHNLDSIASKEDLEAYVRKAAFEASQIYEKASFITLLMPIHEQYDILMLQHPEMSGVFQETGWSMDLESGEMSHEARRIVAL